MRDRPTFSIVIPVYNRAQMLARTLASVLAQTDGDYECIVVDDGSDDRDELRHLIEGLGDARFCCIRQANGGASSARNRGIQRARGEFIAFLDSDDLFVPTKLEVVRPFAEGSPRVAFYSPALVDRGGSRTWIRPSRGILPSETVAEYLFVQNHTMPTPTLVVPRKAALATLFDPMLRKGEDPDFCVRLAASGVRFVMIDEPLVIWDDATNRPRASSRLVDTSALETRVASLGARERAGYRATVLAYEIAGARPLLAAIYLVQGLLNGVPAKVVARQILRAFMPERAYRRLVNGFVERFGRVS